MSLELNYTGKIVHNTELTSNHLIKTVKYKRDFNCYIMLFV